MNLHELSATPGATKKRKRVGRRPGFEGGQMPLFRRLPKRGFSNAKFKKVWATINVSALEKFDSNTEITPELLLEKGLIKKLNHGLKILGNGELTKPLNVKAQKFTRSAIEKIEAAGGKAEVI